MGDFHDRVTVTKGPQAKRVIKRVRSRRQRTKTARHPDDMSYVYVRDDLNMPFGVLRMTIRSSSVQVPTLDASWTRHADTINSRLADNDGQAKGRVLFAVAHDERRREVVVGALCYHLESAEVCVLSVHCSDDAKDKEALVINGLLRCAERISTEASRGRKSRVLWKVHDSKAQELRTSYAFRTHTQAGGHQIILRRDGEVPPRQPKRPN